MRGLLTSLLGLAVAGPVAAQSCFWSADFESGELPAGWTGSTTTILATGETIAAWAVASSQQANAGGFFPVPDAPIGNRFAMVNDDAAPCDCDLQDAVLTTGPIDLGGRQSVALECRVFHDEAFGSSPAVIEASTNGSDWTELLTLASRPDAWQHLLVDLSAYDGAPSFQLRFRWSDGGQWASGFALDDVCLLERAAHDIRVVGITVGDATLSPFLTSTRSLAYAALPLEQAAPLQATVTVMNRGVDAITLTSISVEALLDGSPLGTQQIAPDAVLEPGERRTFVVQGLPAPTGAGQVELLALASISAADGNPSDNGASATLRITGPGWPDGYGAMALDAGTPQGLQRSASNFIAAVRMELVNPGSSARGISAMLDPGSQVGQQVRGILMDASFVLVDTTLRHTLTETDMQAAAMGEPIYLPFPSPSPLPAADCFAGLQRLTGQGEVGVLTSGNGPVGSAAFMQGATFDITWLTAMPMVRLHLNDYGVGITSPERPAANLRIWPMPMSDAGWLEHRFQEDKASLVITNTNGAEVLRQALGRCRGVSTVRMDVQHLPAGAYVVRIEERDRVTSALMLVSR